MQAQSQNAVTDIASAAPPVTVALAHWAKWSIPDWVQFLTAIYLLVVISHKLWRWYREAKNHRQHGRFEADAD